MPYFRAPFTILNGDTASASYLTSMVQVSGYASAASVLIGNAASSTASSLTEITMGGNMSLSTTGVLNTASAITVTGALSGASLTITGSATITSDLNVATVTITGAATASSLSLTTSLPVLSGGTGSSTATGARVNLNRGDTTLTDAATIATDCSTGNVFKVTLGGNRTLGAPTNLVAGATYIWRITQDATGSRTLTYASVFKFPSGAAPVLTTTANALDILSAVSDGTNVYATAAYDLR